MSRLNSEGRGAAQPDFRPDGTPAVGLAPHRSSARMRQAMSYGGQAGACATSSIDADQPLPCCTPRCQKSQSKVPVTAATHIRHRRLSCSTVPCDTCSGAAEPVERPLERLRWPVCGHEVRARSIVGHGGAIVTRRAPARHSLAIAASTQRGRTSHRLELAVPMSKCARREARRLNARAQASATWRSSASAPRSTRSQITARLALRVTSSGFVAVVAQLGAAHYTPQPQPGTSAPLPRTSSSWSRADAHRRALA